MELENPIPPLHLLPPRWHRPWRYLVFPEKEACPCWPGSRVLLYKAGCWQTVQFPPSVNCMFHADSVHHGWNVECINTIYYYDDIQTELSSLIQPCCWQVLMLTRTAICKYDGSFCLAFRRMLLSAISHLPLIQCSDQSQLVSCADILMAIPGHWKMYVSL